MVEQKANILVVGAGASGLSFALQCLQHNVQVRIIDKRSYGSRIAKATGVAQGVWKQLEQFGVCPKKLGAIPMKNFVFFDDSKLVSNVPVPLIDRAPPAYLYPQHKLEELLETLLNEQGVFIEYGVGFHSYSQTSEEVTVCLSCAESESLQECKFNWVIGADGAHSDVRASLNVSFVGRDYPECWSVAEISTEQWPSEIQAKLNLHSDGIGLFLSQPSSGIVQGILNSEGVASALKAEFGESDLIYERNFTVSLRRVISPRVNRFWLIGDAAHVQSPVGGQGLNLAIWDGLNLGKALCTNDLTVEKRLANRAKRVLYFTDFDYKMLSTKQPVIRFLRNKYWALASRYPLIARWFFKIISGVY